MTLILSSLEMQMKSEYLLTFTQNDTCSGYNNGVHYMLLGIMENQNYIGISFLKE